MAIPSIHNARRTAFFPMEKDAIRSSTHALPEPPLLSNHTSATFELSPTAKEKQKSEEKARGLLTSGNETEISSNGRKLSQEEQKEVERIKRIDREVRRRELANRAVAGEYARGAVSFEYVTGPDGKKYAVEGHINIAVRSVPNNPKATIRKAQAIRNINLTSGSSPQGRSVSAEVARMEREARMELKTEQRKESDNVTKAGNAVETTDTTPSQDLILNYKNPFNPVESSLSILA
jgi:hypothetical protein